MNEKIRVFIVEDDIDWQKGLVSILNNEEDIIIVGATDNEVDAINLIKNLGIDIILMDISLNNKLQQGIYLTSEIKELTNAKIIMLTSFDDQETIIRAFSAGASNYIVKSSFEKIANAIRETNNCIMPIETLAKNYADLKKEIYLKDLSPSERDLYNYYEKGHKLNEISKITKKSMSTLRNQVKSILSKLGAKNLKQAQKKEQYFK